MLASLGLCVCGGMVWPEKRPWMRASGKCPERKFLVQTFPKLIRVGCATVLLQWFGFLQRFHPSVGRPTPGWWKGGTWTSSSSRRQRCTSWDPNMNALWMPMTLCLEMARICNGLQWPTKPKRPQRIGGYVNLCCVFTGVLLWLS